MPNRLQNKMTDGVLEYMPMNMPDEMSEYCVSHKISVIKQGFLGKKTIVFLWCYNIESYLFGHDLRIL